MELISIDEIQKFQDSRVIKEIPMLTDQLMATLLFIGSNTNIPAHIHTFIDEIDYVIKGCGNITVDNKSKSIHKGMMILVPRGKSHFFSTSKEHLIIMAISPIIGSGKDSDTKHKTKKNQKGGKVKINHESSNITKGG